MSLALDRLSSVHGAALDGRAASVRFQQSQLIALHAKLQHLQAEACEAIVSDRGVTAAEAEIECATTILAVKQYYESINFDQCVQREYRVAQGLNSPGRRVGCGVVLIRPAKHTRWYSIVATVAAAIAAGNTVAIEVGHFAVDRLLPTLFSCLDAETYQLIDGRPTETEQKQVSIVVDQTGELSLPNCLSSKPQLRSVAVVDRTANVEQAANTIVAAHVAYRGASPHAPDLILVNEWVKREFVNACIRLAPDDSRRERVTASDKVRQTIAEAESLGEASVIGTTSLMLVDIRDRRSSVVAEARPCGAFLPIMTITSLVDAVVALEGSKCLVAYHFAQPAAAKFLSQQINSRLAVANHIPPELLVGPAIPLHNGQPSSFPMLRYSTEMLSQPRPEYIQEAKKPAITLQELKDLDRVALDRVRVEARSALRSTGQGSGTAIGFFEQGILVGAVFIVLPVVSLVGYGGWYTIRVALSWKW
ncbi:hypothetical protein ANOM_005718 [Aspergillus nomiae NRRL 13137]|uniref:Aldehyde dehydrogenase domain-containing protein n=1 Tax=Aspergillus nomiae NRRL (strain ATCC 15546 / NRRL 13137 / CBS 260.88 / M93) TaxID=1509407 RepID=A0A0L1J1R4_ASPN3|nr:uncharacterized protein ANOM_005718 [Aspergillus nomiae NRRL 13137]KNG85751.1 hypothetical protein ANOM_005718 [Aspergillus nomiae NRRL 13137]